jgi:hypothetical protein
MELWRSHATRRNPSTFTKPASSIALGNSIADFIRITDSGGNKSSASTATAMGVATFWTTMAALTGINGLTDEEARYDGKLL